MCLIQPGETSLQPAYLLVYNKFLFSHVLLLIECNLYLTHSCKPKLLIPSVTKRTWDMDVCVYYLKLEENKKTLTHKSSDRVVFMSKT